MTEAEWLTCNDVDPMLQTLRRREYDRKARLFACACCHQIWTYICHADLRNAVEVSERFADGEVSLSQLKTAAQKARRAETDLRARRTHSQPLDRVSDSAAAAASIVVLKGIDLVARAAVHARRAAEASDASHNQAGLLREIFGNPFRPVVFSSSWRTDTAVSLAKQMYESREFSAMPILADALQDAGCDNEEVLSHCRDTKQVHVRGCWVVDLVLEKS